jgi:hypothetical protein
MEFEPLRPKELIRVELYEWMRPDAVSGTILEAETPWYGRMAMIGLKSGYGGKAESVPN